MNKITVSHVVYQSSEETTYKELFEGFNHLWAITYSSSTKLIDEIAATMDHTEVIFGYKEVLDNNISNLLSLQMAVTTNLTTSPVFDSLYQKIQEGKLTLLLSNSVKSHEKIFILRSNDGRTRVITGSANFSYSALNGIQREDILVFDDKKAFDYYLNKYQSFKDSSTSPFTEKLLGKIVKDGKELAKEDLKTVPLIEAMIVDNVDLEIQEVEDEPDILLTPEVEEMKKYLKDLGLKLNFKKNKNSSILKFEKKSLDPLLKKYRDELKKKKEAARAYPKLILEDDTLSFNDKVIPLQQDQESVKNELLAFLAFFEGLDKYSYDKSHHLQEAKDNYYLFACWYLSSLFIPKLRLIANSSYHDVLNFPIVGILNGASHAGKSTFLKLLSRIMCGKQVDPLPGKQFQESKVTGYRQVYRGLPINYDDVSKYGYRNHAEKIIKDDFYGLNEKDEHFPVVAFATNEVEGIKGEISKRALVCRIDIQLNDEEVRKVSHETNLRFSSIKGAFFAEYVKRMIPEVNKMIDMMENQNEIKYDPDIFELSSRILNEMVLEYTGKSYDFVKIYSLSDVKNPTRKSSKAIETLILLWNTEKNNFVINRNNNTLTYRTNNDQFKEELYNVADELPFSLCCKKTDSTIIMKLDEAEKLLGIKFKKGFFK